jgi:lysophospholipase L1-like esterase
MVRTAPARAFSAAVLAGMLALGCAHAPPTRPGNARHLIVAIGDSITVGAGDGGLDCGAARLGKAGFCPRLEQRLGLPVISEGVCGDTSFGARDRAQALLERWRPDALLILLSPNDWLHDPAKVAENLRAIVRVARECAAVPVLGTLTPVARSRGKRDPFIRDLNSRIAALAAEEQVALADHYAAFTRAARDRANAGGLLADGLHPNAAGYDLMARTWLAALERAGVVTPPPDRPPAVGSRDGAGPPAPAP